MFIDQHTSSELDAAHQIFETQNETKGVDIMSSFPMRSISPPRLRPKPSSRGSISAVAGSFHTAPKPDLSLSLLLRFNTLPYNVLKRILDEIVHEAVGSLYTGCRACRWQEWHRCICRHWQKTFCTLATLDNVIGQHVREHGRALARAWGYSSADAFGPYAAGFRFTGNVIGGYRVADFLFADDALTALPELDYSDVETVTEPETDSDEAQTPTDPSFWAPPKALRLTGIATYEPNLGHNKTLPARLRNRPQALTAIDPPRSQSTFSTLPRSRRERPHGPSRLSFKVDPDVLDPPRALSSPTAAPSNCRERFSGSFGPGLKSLFESISSRMSASRRQSTFSIDSRSSFFWKFASYGGETVTEVINE